MAATASASGTIPVSEGIMGATFSKVTHVAALVSKEGVAESSVEVSPPLYKEGRGRVASRQGTGVSISSESAALSAVPRQKGIKEDIGKRVKVFVWKKEKEEATTCEMSRLVGKKVKKGGEGAKTAKFSLPGAFSPAVCVRPAAVLKAVSFKAVEKVRRPKECGGSLYYHTRPSSQPVQGKALYEAG